MLQGIKFSQSPATFQCQQLIPLLPGSAAAVIVAAEGVVEPPMLRRMLRLELQLRPLLPQLHHRQP
jgi:hypothetical protein